VHICTVRADASPSCQQTSVLQSAVPWPRSVSMQPLPVLHALSPTEVVGIAHMRARLTSLNWTMCGCSRPRWLSTSRSTCFVICDRHARHDQRRACDGLVIAVAADAAAGAALDSRLKVVLLQDAISGLCTGVQSLCMSLVVETRLACYYYPQAAWPQAMPEQAGCGLQAVPRAWEATGGSIACGLRGTRVWKNSTFGPRSMNLTATSSPLSLWRMSSTVPVPPAPNAPSCNTECM